VSAKTLTVGVFNHPLNNDPLLPASYIYSLEIFCTSAYRFKDSLGKLRSKGIRGPKEIPCFIT
jgi:hypothetical protein